MHAINTHLVTLVLHGFIWVKSKPYNTKITIRSNIQVSQPFFLNNRKLGIQVFQFPTRMTQTSQ